MAVSTSSWSPRNRSGAKSESHALRRDRCAYYLAIVPKSMRRKPQRQAVLSDCLEDDGPVVLQYPTNMCKRATAYPNSTISNVTPGPKAFSKLLEGFSRQQSFVDVTRWAVAFQRSHGGRHTLKGWTRFSINGDPEQNGANSAHVHRVACASSKRCMRVPVGAEQDMLVQRRPHARSGHEALPHQHLCTGATLPWAPKRVEPVVSVMHGPSAGEALGRRLGFCERSKKPECPSA